MSNEVNVKDRHIFDRARVYGDARVYGEFDLCSIGPIGSRKAFLTIHSDSTIQVRVTTGCFSGSMQEFEDAVEKKHGSSPYGQQYRAAIALAKLVVNGGSDV